MECYGIIGLEPILSEHLWIKKIETINGNQKRENMIFSYNIL